MFNKIEILLIIFTILIIFYLVIAWGAGKRKKSNSLQIKNYLFNVRALIIIIAIIAIILSFFL